MDRTAHWRTVYTSKSSLEVSWYREHLTTSLVMIERSGSGTAAAIIDIGAGASTLMDDLLDAGWNDLTAVEIAPEAIETVRRRLGARADRIHWIEGDILTVSLPEGRYDIWHDRAVFHFLTEPKDRQRYIRLLSSALRPGGEAIMATFAIDGPLKCSGLDVHRYDARSLAEELGSDFELIEQQAESHRTPSGAEQRFLYCRFRHLPHMQQ